MLTRCLRLAQKQLHVSVDTRSYDRRLHIGVFRLKLLHSVQPLDHRMWTKEHDVGYRFLLSVFAQEGHEVIGLILLLTLVRAVVLKGKLVPEVNGAVLAARRVQVAKCVENWLDLKILADVRLQLQLLDLFVNVENPDPAICCLTDELVLVDKSNSAHFPAGSETTFTVFAIQATQVNNIDAFRISLKQDTNPVY